MGCVSQTIHFVCFCFELEFIRIYTQHSVFCINLHTFVNSSVNPLLFRNRDLSAGLLYL
ncbi:unnamed protein product [Bubo scandiacus]|uniref:Uncharacterized protein n=2 Tax=Strigidae TaxID=30459 RepID=A0A663M6U1_ATHCN